MALELATELRRTLIPHRIERKIRLRVLLRDQVPGIASEDKFQEELA